MLRDICSGLALATLTGTFYTIGMHFGPLNWNLSDDAFALLIVVGIVVSVTAFLVVSFGSNLDRRLRKADAEIDQRSRRFEEDARAKALRLNAYALECMDGVAMTNATPDASESSNVIPFPARPAHLRGPGDRSEARFGLSLG